MELEQLQAVKPKKTGKKIALIATPIIVLAVAGVLFFLLCMPLIRYNEAVSLFEAQKYEEAYKAFLALDGYKDSNEYLPLCRYQQALSLLEEEKDEEAFFILLAMQNYKDAQRLLEKFEIRFSEQRGSDGSLYRHVYDGNGNLIQEESRYPDGYESRSEYEYNEQGEQIRLIFSSDTMQSETTFRYEYDSDGNMIRRESVDQYGGKTVDEFSYDAQGNQIKAVSSDANGVYNVVEFVFDEDGNVTKNRFVDRDGNETLYEYTYDAKGNRTKYVVHSHDGKEDVIEYFYDENGNQTGYHYVDRNGGVTETVYTLDSAGNPIRAVTTYDYGTETITRSYHANGALAEERVRIEQKDGTVDAYDITYNEYGLRTMWRDVGTNEETTYEYKNVHVVYNPNLES